MQFGLQILLCILIGVRANECDSSDGDSCRSFASHRPAPVPGVKKLSLQEQFSEQLQRSRELRGLTDGPIGVSMTRRLKIDRKERQRQRREALKDLPPGERAPSVSPGCDPNDKLCDRRKRQEARRIERQNSMREQNADEL